jgi:hypothetical protein
LSKTDPCTLATKYAERMAKADTVESLKYIGLEIKNSLSSIDGWKDWLTDIYLSNLVRINTPDVPIEGALNKQGLEALKKSK